MFDFFHGICIIIFWPKKHKSNIAGREPDFQDQPKLAAECVNQHLKPTETERNFFFIKMDIDL